MTSGVLLHSIFYGSLTPSNFRVTVQQSNCTGCGLCGKRRPMEALRLVDTPPVKGRKTTITMKDGRQRELTNKTGKVCALNPERCIGCGVCAYNCQSQLLTLQCNQVEHHPPQTGRDWVTQFIADTRATR